MELTSKNIKWLLYLIDNNSGKLKEEAKPEMEELRTKLESIRDVEVPISITEDDIENAITLIEELRKISQEYSRNTDLSAVESYDVYKKQIAGKMATLSALKAKFLEQSGDLEDYLKNELRVNLILEIMRTEKDSKGKSVSATFAKELVLADVRYINFKKKVRTVSNMANRIKSEFSFFMQLWQQVFQSVSTASKEKFASKNNNSA